MTEIIVIESETNIIELETSTQHKTIEIETATIDSLPNITVEILSGDRVIVDVPDDSIPFSKISGDIPVDRISGLDEYLDSYAFDCGTP